jgi:hypothetical protein
MYIIVRICCLFGCIGPLGLLGLFMYKGAAGPLRLGL